MKEGGREVVWPLDLNTAPEYTDLNTAHFIYANWLPGSSDVHNLPAKQETQVQSLGREDPLEKGTEPTPVFLPGEFHGQRCLVGYSLWGCKELDTTEQLTHTHIC